MKIKKGTLFKIIIVIVDIIALTFFIIACFKWFDKKLNQDNEDVTEINTTNETFKKFNYQIPNGVEYSVVSEHKFMFKTADYEATIMPYAAVEDSDLIPIDTYADGYEQRLLEAGVTASKLKVITVGDRQVYTYNISGDKNSVLCYYQTFSPFYYEINLVNSDNGYSVDALEEIIGILQGTYYDQEVEEKYYYYTSDEVFLLKEKER